MIKLQYNIHLMLHSKIKLFLPMLICIICSLLHNDFSNILICEEENKNENLNSYSTLIGLGLFASSILLMLFLQQFTDNAVMDPTTISENLINSTIDTVANIPAVENVNLNDMNTQTEIIMKDYTTHLDNLDTNSLLKKYILNNQKQLKTCIEANDFVSYTFENCKQRDELLYHYLNLYFEELQPILLKNDYTFERSKSIIYSLITRLLWLGEFDNYKPEFSPFNDLSPYAFQHNLNEYKLITSTFAKKT